MNIENISIKELKKKRTKVYKRLCAEVDEKKLKDLLELERELTLRKVGI